MVTDARNLLTALRCTNLHTPAEKNFITHLLWLQCKLRSGVLDALIWSDTRDMTADGHTKGSISRDAIHKVMNGYREINYARETLRLHTPASPPQSSSSCSHFGPTRSRDHRARGARPCPTRPAPLQLLLLLAAAAMARSSAAGGDAPKATLGPMDSPFTLLGLKNTPLETVLKYKNADFNKAYRRAALQLHPDKVEDKTDTQLIASRTELFQKLELARDQLVLADESNPDLSLIHI